MIIREFHTTRQDGVSLYRTYSSEGYYIMQNETGNIYPEAIDVENAPYTYSETTDKIEVITEGTNDKRNKKHRKRE